MVNEKIKFKRTELEKTQDDMVFELRKIGCEITKTRYVNIELGKSEPKASDIKFLCKVLKVSYKYLLD